jgi:FecR protein
VVLLMRACRRIAPLLLIAVAAPVRAGAAPATPRVGRVVTLSPEVSGTMPQGPTLRLASQAEVCEHMEVATEAAARAQIVIGGPPALCGAAVSNPPAPGGAPAGGAPALPPLRGALIMGPKSRVVFERWVIEQATRPVLTLRAQLGEFLAFFMPRPRGLAEGKVQIVTPTATIELHGTAVCLRVAADGTTAVAVLEGEVTVRGAAAGEVRVPQGSWTDVAPGQRPRPPSLLGPRPGTLSPQAGGPAFTMPAEMLVVDPPHLDPGRLLNLPKAGHP